MMALWAEEHHREQLHQPPFTANAVNVPATKAEKRCAGTVLNNFRRSMVQQNPSIFVIASPIFWSFLCWHVVCVWACGSALFRFPLELVISSVYVPPAPSMGSPWPCMCMCWSLHCKLPLLHIVIWCSFTYVCTSEMMQYELHPACKTECFFWDQLGQPVGETIAAVATNCFWTAQAVSSGP